MDPLSPEILHIIASLLSVKDACNLRLVNKAFSVIAGAYILPEVSFQFHEKDLARLRSIAEHPVLSPNVTRLCYISRTYESTPVDREVFESDYRMRRYVDEIDISGSLMHHLDSTSELSAQYQLYKQLVSSQKAFYESRADVRCLEEILPNLTGLRDVIMETGYYFYPGLRVNPVRFDGCVRGPDYEREPEGVATLEALLTALASQKLSIPRLRAGELNYRFFQKGPKELSRLFEPFKDATHIHLALCIEEDDMGEDITGDTQRCRTLLQPGVVANILMPMTRLRDLSFSSPPYFEKGFVKRAASLRHIVSPGHRWYNLASVTLERVDCERSELWDFLLLHKDSLVRLCLNDVLLTKGSWAKLLMDIRKGLYLRKPCICGTLRGYAEDGEGTPALKREVYKLGTSEDGLSVLRSSVNCYCLRGGELYPDELPLTMNVVDKYYDSHVRPAGMGSDWDDTEGLNQFSIDPLAGDSGPNDHFWPSDSSEDDLSDAFDVYWDNNVGFVVDYGEDEEDEDDWEDDDEENDDND